MQNHAVRHGRRVRSITRTNKHAQPSNWPDLTQRAAPEKKSAPHRLGMVAMHGIAEPGWTNGSYQALSSEGFMRNPIVHRTIRMVTEAAASMPLLAYQGITETTQHPALSLLNRPNRHQSGIEFMEALYGHLLLSGNAYLERIDASPDSHEMHLLRPDRVTIELDDQGWPSGYCYRVGATKRLISATDSNDALPILHISQFHPLEDHLGFAPLQAALMALDIHNAAGRWNKALLDNAARPSGALVYQSGDDSNLTEEQFDRLKRELEEGYTGQTNAGRPLLLDGGLDWKAMGMTPRDMDFIEAKNAASRDIALAFGVPPMLLGIPGDNTYANYQEANRAFYRLTVLPLVKRTLCALSNWLEPLYGGQLRLEPDLDQVSGLSSEREALWARIESASFLTENEKREAVGYTPLRRDASMQQGAEQ